MKKAALFILILATLFSLTGCTGTIMSLLVSPISDKQTQQMKSATIKYLQKMPCLMNIQLMQQKAGAKQYKLITPNLKNKFLDQETVGENPQTSDGVTDYNTSYSYAKNPCLYSPDTASLVFLWE